MKRLVRLLCLCLLLSVSMAGAAGKPNYRGVAIDDGAVYFLDLSSVKVRNGALTGWVATEERSPFNGARSTHFLAAVNCATDEFWIVTSIYYSENGLRGEVVKTYGQSKRQPAPPGSLGDAWIQSICGIQAKMNPDLVGTIQPADVSRRAARSFYADEEGALATAIYPNVR